LPGEGREQWVNRAGNIWPALEHAGTVLQGRRNMWVMATSAMTSFSQDCLIIIIIIGGDFFLPRLSRHHHYQVFCPRLSQEFKVSLCCAKYLYDPPE